MKTTEYNARNLLKSIGIGDFNATAIIPYVWLAPATTDPKSTAIIQIVTHLQRQLALMGAGVVPTGYVDPATARALRILSGPRWSSMSWSSNIAAVVTAREAGREMTPPRSAMDAAMRPPQLVSDVALGQSPTSMGFLPDVPGGLVTYGIFGFLLYRHFAKRKAAR